MKLIPLLLACSLCLAAENGAEAWIRYRPLASPVSLPATIVTLGNSLVQTAAQQELLHGIQGMLNRTDRLTTHLVDEDMIVLATAQQVQQSFPELTVPNKLIADGYWLKRFTNRGHTVLLITGLNNRGILYGTFDLLRRLAFNQPIDKLDADVEPRQAVRWVNEWNNLDGSIERGYAGNSIFFAGGNVVPDLTRANEYARLLASIGINGCTVNNVNANPKILSPEFLPQLSRIAAAFRPWGVQMSISVPFNAPKTVGGLDTFDPQDERVKEWWATKANQIYQAIPDLAGFVVKADSEGQLGPSTYGRSHAEAANVMAAALKPHGGVLVYRGFVYNHHLDWHDLKNDRAKAAYDNFHALDGKFADNALLQIKHGPIDFQTREPISPLIGALPNTRKTMELQITQEYTGQQRHLCYLVPMWKQLLDFDLRLDGRATPVQAQLTGLVGVSNVGLDSNWLGSDLAMANLYGFGRLAWNPSLNADQITHEWTTLTWGPDPEVVKTIADLELESWQTYENYTGPLGIGTLTDILHGHYGPGIETAERNGWGQWIRADHEGIGMDRTVATGTGYIGQYSPEVAHTYESLSLCPESLLLFMHHVPYSYQLHSGKTLIQQVYDSHYQGAAFVETFVDRWKHLQGKVDADRFQAVLNRLEYQAGHAIVWRDAICNWFLRQSGIADKQGRVGNYPDRIEAENMKLEGYQPVDVTPWEDASNGKAVSCPLDGTVCTAGFEFNKSAGWYSMKLQYFDTTPGNAKLQVLLNDQLLKTWQANADLPWKTPNGDTSIRAIIGRVALRPGDKIRILGMPDDADRASLDYLDLTAVQ